MNDKITLLTGLEIKKIELLTGEKIIFGYGRDSVSVHVVGVNIPTFLGTLALLDKTGNLISEVRISDTYHYIKNSDAKKAVAFQFTANQDRILD